MNIFILSKDPVEAASFMCDRHINKMIVESCQMMTTAIRHIFPITYKEFQHLRDFPESRFKFPAPFDIGSGHYNHPCSAWVRKDEVNLSWLATHTQALLQEKAKRWKNMHVYNDFVTVMYNSNPTNNGVPTLFSTAFSTPALKMLANRDEYQSADAQVVLYRMYYALEKALFARWNSTPPPVWWDKYVTSANRICLHFPKVLNTNSPTLCGLIAKEIDNFLSQGG